MTKFDIAFTHGMRINIDGSAFYHYHSYNRKCDAKRDASDARLYDLNARVIPKSNGRYAVVLQRRK
jgi:hypothetical protein